MLPCAQAIPTAPARNAALTTTALICIHILQPRGTAQTEGSSLPIVDTAHPMPFEPQAAPKISPAVADSKIGWSAMRGVVAGEGVGAGAELGLAEHVERRLDRVEELVHVAGIGLDKEEPGNHLAGRVALLKVGQGRNPVAGIVIDGQFAQPKDRAVVLDHGLDGSPRVVGDELVAADV